MFRWLWEQQQVIHISKTCTLYIVQASVACVQQMKTAQTKPLNYLGCQRAPSPPPKDWPVPHSGVGVNHEVREYLMRPCHQGWRPLAKEPPRALREVDMLTRNPEKLANAGGRCWKDTLGQKRSFRTHRPPYPTRRGLVTAWQETKKLLVSLDGQWRTWRWKLSKTTRIGETTKNNKEVWRNLCSGRRYGWHYKNVKWETCIHDIITIVFNYNNYNSFYKAVTR